MANRLRVQSEAGHGGVGGLALGIAIVGYIFAVFVFIAIVGYIFAVFVFPALDRSTYARVDSIPCAVFATPAPSGCATTTTTRGR